MFKDLLHRFHHHNNIKHKTIPVLFTQCTYVCVFACVSVSSKDTHFGRLKKVLDKEHIANFGLWWQTFCFFPSFRFHDFSSSVFQFFGFLMDQPTVGLTCTILEDCTALHCTDRWQVICYIFFKVENYSFKYYFPFQKK